MSVTTQRVVDYTTRPVVEGATHGTHCGYCVGCRCEPCTLAHREYERERVRLRARPDSEWTSEDFSKRSGRVLRKHIRMLQRNGVGLAEIERKSGVNYHTLSKILAGTRTIIQGSTETQVLGVRYVGTNNVQRHLRYLYDHGITMKQVATVTGLNQYSLVVQILNGTRSLVTVEDEDLLLSLPLIMFGKRASDKR